MVCENGLVISTEQFNDVKMRHMGYTFEELQIQIREMVEQLPLTVESMNKMKQSQFESGKGNITKEYLKGLIQVGTEFYSSNPQMGLVVKTYQSDIFNNWINTEWIDGENGINAITAVYIS